MSWLLMLSAVTYADIPPPISPRMVAAEVVERCGDLGKVSELAFTFVVQKDGAEVARRSHRWQPQAGQLSVTHNGETVSMTVEAAMPAAADDPRWATLAPGVPAEQALKAWGAFVNDGYWLLAPCKVLDPGAQLDSDYVGQSLTVTYEGVGLTPGDRYTLSLRDDGSVRAWDFTLVSGREGRFTWSPYQAFGPLRLSLERTSSDGAMIIRFEDVLAR